MHAMSEYHPSESAVATHLDEKVDPKFNHPSEFAERLEKPSRETKADREVEEHMHRGD